jgi:CBS domain-containing protein
MLNKKIKDVMSPGVEVVTPNTTLREAAERMRDLNVGPLPICDGQKLAGMVTDRDIVVRGIAMGHDPNTSKVRDVLTADVEYCYEDDSVEKAARYMGDKQIRRLMVVDKNKNLVGIVSLGDISQEISGKKAGETLEEISEPSRPNY